MKKSKAGRPKGKAHQIPDNTITQIEEVVNLSKQQINNHIDRGGDAVEIEGAKYPVVDSVGNDDLLTLEPPKAAGRPTKRQKEFEETNIPLKRKEVLGDIDSSHLKELRKLSKQHPDKHVWLNNGLGFYHNGTLFNRFSMPISSQENFDVKLSAILQGLIMYLKNPENADEYTSDGYFNSIGITRKWIEEKLKTHPEFNDTYELARQICKERLIKKGFKRDGSTMAKFLLQAEHGMIERKAVETTTLNIRANKEEVESILQSDNAEQAKETLNKLLNSRPMT